MAVTSKKLLKQRNKSTQKQSRGVGPTLKGNPSDAEVIALVSFVWESVKPNLEIGYIAISDIELDGLRVRVDAAF